MEKRSKSYENLNFVDEKSGIKANGNDDGVYENAGAGVRVTLKSLSHVDEDEEGYVTSGAINARVAETLPKGKGTNQDGHANSKNPICNKVLPLPQKTKALTGGDTEDIYAEGNENPGSPPPNQRLPLACPNRRLAVPVSEETYEEVRSVRWQGNATTTARMSAVIMNKLNAVLIVSVAVLVGILAGVTLGVVFLTMNQMEGQDSQTKKNISAPSEGNMSEIKEILRELQTSADRGFHKVETILQATREDVQNLSESMRRFPNQEQRYQKLMVILQNEGWVQIGKHIYRHFTEHVNFTDAMANCSDIGGNLTFSGFINPEETGFIEMLKTFTTQRTWIGLKREETTQRWKWIDGSTFKNITTLPLVYNNNEVARCGYLNNQSIWFDVCNRRMSYLCEVQI